MAQVIAKTPKIPAPIQGLTLLVTEYASRKVLKRTFLIFGGLVFLDLNIVSSLGALALCRQDEGEPSVDLRGYRDTALELGEEVH